MRGVEAIIRMLITLTLLSLAQTACPAYQFSDGSQCIKCSNALTQQHCSHCPSFSWNTTSNKCKAKDCGAADQTLCSDCPNYFWGKPAGSTASRCSNCSTAAEPDCNSPFCKDNWIYIASACRVADCNQASEDLCLFCERFVWMEEHQP